MENNKKPASASDDIDLGRYFSLFISNWLWVAIAMFLALSLAYAFNRYSPRVYNVKSTLLIEEEQNTGTITDLEKLLPSGDFYGSWRNLENEITILESYALNYRVMEEMPEFHIAYVPVQRNGFQGQRMYKTSPFVVKMLSEKQPSNVHISIKFTTPETYLIEVNEDDLEEMREKQGTDFPDEEVKKEAEKRKAIDNNHEYHLGEAFTEFGFDFVIEKRDSVKSSIKEDSRYLIWFESPADLANAYRSRLTVKPTKEGASVFTLSYDGYSPEQAADYLNKLMELYGTQGLEWKNRAAESTILFIEDQLGLISDSLRKAESSMESFRMNNRFVDLTLEGSLVLQKLESLESEKNETAMQMQYYEYLLDYLNSREEEGLIISPSIMGVTDPALIKLVEEFSALQLKKKKLSSAMKESLPMSVQADIQMEEARAALRENVSSAISQIRLAVRSINERIARVEQELDRLPGTERRLIGIQRKFDLNNSVYTFLLERRAEAGIARASQMSDNRIIDLAVPHNHSLVKPQSTRNYLVAVLLGLFVPMMMIVIIDLLNNKIIGRHDIEAITRAPILGYISHSNYEVEVPVIDKPGSTLAESFRSVRTSLAFYTGQTKCPVIIISSAISGEGKTFVAVNLASIIAMMNKKVLIIGLDMRKPRVHNVLNEGNGRGMSQYLSNNANFEDVIIPTYIENLFFAPAGPVPPNPAELIASPRMAEFIARARNEYDTIIIDTPPVGIVTDALLLAPLSNISLFIVRQRYTTRESVSMIDEIYQKGDMGNVALVVNDISTSGYYGYGLRYGYTLGYGHRYYDPGNYFTKGHDRNMAYYTNE